MFEENAERNHHQPDEKLTGARQVNCFVCKRQVDKQQAKQLAHPKEKSVWVCKEHIKE